MKSLKKSFPNVHLSLSAIFNNPFLYYKTTIAAQKEAQLTDSQKKKLIDSFTSNKKTTFSISLAVRFAVFFSLTRETLQNNTLLPVGNYGGKPITVGLLSDKDRYMTMQVVKMEIISKLNLNKSKKVIVKQLKKHAWIECAKQFYGLAWSVLCKLVPFAFNF